MRGKTNNILVRLIAVCVLLLSTAGVSVGQAPVANFTGSPLSGCSPLIVTFQDQSTGATSWNWDFGNGNTSTLQNPTASYFAPGSYTVTLTATNTSGNNTVVKTGFVTVYEPPVVNFIGDNLNGCFPLRVQFSDLSTGGSGNTNVSWNWDFGNGNTSTLQNPLAIYTTAGTFTVTLRVTNDKGCVKTLSRPNYITVTNGVRSAFTNTQPSVCNAPATIAFTNNSTGPPTLSYQWDFGDGNFSTAISPTHTYNTAGTFIATLVTYSSAGCQDTARSAPIIIGGYNNSFTAPVVACADETITFTNTTTPAPLSSTWAFGDGGTGTGTPATHIYTTPGTYTVWLYNSFANCMDSVQQSITINARPVADFIAPVTISCQPPLTVNFQDITTGGAVAWDWDFGDGGTSTAQNPSYTYNNYGSFTVTLIATNAAGCKDTMTKADFIIVQRATISIPSLPARGCIPFTITPVPTITAVDAVTSYQWDFGDGGTSNVANPTYTYTAQGTYTVRLIITTSTGCTDTLTIANAVRVGTKPVADFSAVPIPVCGRQPVFFTDLSVPADEWNWDFGDGSTSTIQSPSHQYSDTGYFSIQLIATNNGCPDTLRRIDYVHVLPPIARFNYTVNCANRLQVNFTDNSIAPLTWDWDFGDGGTSTAQSPSHTYPALGNYIVRLIVTNGGCADTLIQSIRTVNENPDFTADRLIACKTAGILFTVTGIDPTNIVSYDWNFGDGGTATTSSPSVSHTYTTSGTFTISLVTTDIHGCTDNAVKTNYIRINGPIALFNPTPLSGCAGLTATFADQSTNDGVNAITNWQWDFGDGVIQNFSAPPFTHLYANAGSFNVKLVVRDAAGCADSTIVFNMIVTTDPVPLFVSADTLACPNSTVRFTNNSLPAGVMSQWDFGDGGTSTATSPVYSYAAPGLYTIKLRIDDANGCADSLIRTNYITVDTPYADFTVSDSISSCLPFEVTFANASTYFSSFLWDFGPGQGTSTLRNPVHYYSIPGIYPVKLIVTSPGGCLDSLTRNIQVYDTVGSTVRYLPINGCSPLPVTLNTLTAGPMTSYFWDFGDGYTTTSTTPDINHLYSSFGNFLPKVIMEDPSGCLIPLQGLDTVYVTGANAKFGLDDSLFCDIGTVNFSDSSTFNDPIISYNWTFGDGGSSNQPSPVHPYLAPGTYSVQLIVGTQIGCFDTLAKPNLVRVVQTPLTGIAGDTIICVNARLLQTGYFVQPDTSLVRWTWQFPNGNTYTQQNPPAQVYTTPGTFTVLATATNSSGCVDSTTQTIHVNPLPQINMPGQLTVQSGFPVTIPATYSPNAVSWLWSPFDGLSCTNCPTPDAGPKFNTTYQVFVRDENGCTNIGSIEVIVICKNANLFMPNTFTPNGDGSNDVFYPRGKGLERVKLLRIFNRWGEVVFEKNNFPVNDASVGWNGTYKGKKPLPDVYVYQVEVFCENGDVIRINGNIALVL